MGEMNSPSGRGERTSISGKEPESIYGLPVPLCFLIFSFLYSTHTYRKLSVCQASSQLLERGHQQPKTVFLEFTFHVRRQRR